MNVLVTGASGFIGRHVVNALRAGGVEVITLSRATVPPFADLPHRAVAVDDPAAADAVGEVDLVVHLAGQANASASGADPVGCARVNAQGTLHMLEGARRAGAAFILASSQRVYRPNDLPLDEDAPVEPVDPYGYSKLVAERWVELYHRVYGLRATVLRLFSVYGPGQVIRGGTSGVAAIFVREALAGRPLRVFGHQLRDFVEVSDVAWGIQRVAEDLTIAECRSSGRTYNLATGQATSLRDLAEAVRRALGVDVPVEVHPLDRPESYVADVRRIRTDLGFEASVRLDQGLVRLARWYREHYEAAPEGATDGRAATRSSPAAAE